jgi:NADH:ubiquinone oxidoreductase subunit F (NADH-binding)
MEVAWSIVICRWTRLTQMHKHEGTRTTHMRGKRKQNELQRPGTEPNLLGLFKALTSMPNVQVLWTLNKSGNTGRGGSSATVIEGITP